MLKTFLLAGGAGNEDFCFPLRSTKQKLDQALLDIGYKEKSGAHAHMVGKLTSKTRSRDHKVSCNEEGIRNTRKGCYHFNQIPPENTEKDAYPVHQVSSIENFCKACSNKRPITIASDGDLKGNKGTLGWVIHSAKNEMLI